MKIFSTIKMLAVTCAMAIAFTSCLGDDNNDNNDVITGQRMLSCYAAVTDLATGETTYSKEMVFVIELNWNTGRAGFSFTGLKLGDKTQGTLVFEDLKFKVDDKTFVSSITAAGASGGNTQLGVTTSLTSVDLKWLDRLDYGNLVLNSTQRYEPMFTFSFIMDNKYRIVGSRQPFLLNGKTVSVAPDASTFSNDKSDYSIALDFDKMQASITITRAQFVENMPAQNMVFPGLPMTIADDGTITIESKEFIPTIAGTPQDQFPILDLKGVIIPESGMTLEFVCNVRRAAKYSVHATLDYTSYKKS